jgi:hypothetical protein
MPGPEESISRLSCLTPNKNKGKGKGKATPLQA